MSGRVCDARADTGTCDCAQGCAAQQLREARGEVLGLQRMLEEALKPGFHAPGLCLGCHRSFTERGLKLHAKHCRKLPAGAGRA